MKKYVGFIILGIVLLCITGLIVFIFISKSNLEHETFNLKKGEILTFDKYDIDITILNIASIECEKEKICSLEKNVEVSLKVNYREDVSYITLKSSDATIKQIENSNYYVYLDYKDEKISIDIKDKKDL